MQASQMMFPILMMAAFGAYAVWMMARRKNAAANIGPAFRRFFEQTGYRYADIASAPLDEHVRMGEEKTRALMKGTATYEMHLVKDFHGLPIHHRSFMGGETRRGRQVSVMSCVWTTALATPPRVQWQIADRSLSGAGKAIKEAFSNTTREWQPTFPTRIETGDPVLDKRFVVFGTDPAAVQRTLAAPGLKELLLGCIEVDLCVGPREIYFSDPMQKNIRAGMGGTLGAMAMASDPSKMMESTTPVHERIIELLAVSARASQ